MKTKNELLHAMAVINDIVHRDLYEVKARMADIACDLVEEDIDFEEFEKLMEGLIAAKRTIEKLHSLTCDSDECMEGY